MVKLIQQQNMMLAKIHLLVEKTIIIVFKDEWLIRKFLFLFPCPVGANYCWWNKM